MHHNMGILYQYDTICLSEHEHALLSRLRKNENGKTIHKHEFKPRACETLATRIATPDKDTSLQNGIHNKDTHEQRFLDYHLNKEVPIKEVINEYRHADFC